MGKREIYEIKSIMILKARRKKRHCIEAMRLLKRENGGVGGGGWGGQDEATWQRDFSLMMKFTIGQSLEHRVLEV
jgi:hypothetical protein